MIPLSILYQDERLVAIDKPAGMIVHPGREPEGPEWIAMKRLRDLLGRPVYPIHRLDRPTSGVLLFALDRETSTLTQQAFETRQVEKYYLAVVCGATAERWVCDTPLRKSPEEPEVAARTQFERLRFAPAGSFPADPLLSLSLLKASPETGRFHQIRRHLLEVDLPIVGDFRYAGRERSHELGEILGTGTRMLLQAKELRMKHPHTGEDLVIEAPPDEDFRRCFPLQGEAEPRSLIDEIGSISQLCRIPCDVSCHIPEVLSIADHPVEIVFLPKCSGPSGQPVNFVGGETFP